MSRIPDTVIAEIRERVDIVALVGQRVELKKIGNSFKGLCPFHQEKTPSFHVIPDKHFFHCFGCGKSGDAITFVMELDGERFSDAVRALGEQVGVDVLIEDSPEAKQHHDERQRLLRVNALATQFFQASLRAPAGQAARRYLATRGIGEDVAQTFALGMAPDAWSSLGDFLTQKQVPMELAERLGLIAKRQSGHGHYDKFRNRLMCPIHVPSGEVVAFSGRQLADADPAEPRRDASEKIGPKYINSPGSMLYTKGHVLFGLFAARPAIRKNGRAVVVEGNFDVLALHQAGFAETVAPLGTALTDKQVQTLRLLAPQVILCLDGDAAGKKAALHHLSTLVAAGVKTRVAVLPSGEDPDSFVRTHGPEAFEALLQKAQPAVEYFIHDVWVRTDRRSADERAQAIQEAAALLGKIGDVTHRELLVGEFARAMEVPVGLVLRVIAKGQLSPENLQQNRLPHPTRKTPIPGKELKILAILADHPQLWPRAQEFDIRSLLTNEDLQAIYSALPQNGGLLAALPTDDPELKELVVREVLSGQYRSLEDPSRTLGECVRSLKRDRLTHEAAELGQQIKDAERRGDLVLAKQLALRQLQTRSSAESLR